MATPAVFSQRARLNALQRHRSPGDPAILDAARDLKVARAEDFIKRLVDDAPPLTDSQRARLAAILAPASAPEARAA